MGRVYPSFWLDVLFKAPETVATSVQHELTHKVCDDRKCEMTGVGEKDAFVLCSHLVCLSGERHFVVNDADGKERCRPMQISSPSTDLAFANLSVIRPCCTFNPQNCARTIEGKHVSSCRCSRVRWSKYMQKALCFAAMKCVTQRSNSLPSSILL